MHGGNYPEWDVEAGAVRTRVIDLEKAKAGVIVSEVSDLAWTGATLVDLNTHGVRFPYQGDMAPKCCDNCERKRGVKRVGDHDLCKVCRDN